MRHLYGPPLVRIRRLDKNAGDRVNEFVDIGFLFASILCRNLYALYLSLFIDGKRMETRCYREAASDLLQAPQAYTMTRLLATPLRQLPISC